MDTTTTNNPADVLGPPPSYDSVMYGDAASGAIPPGSNIHPLPAQYPNAPYTYPVPPSYPVNPAYSGAPSQPQYPTTYNTTQPTGTAIIQPTIVHANQQSLTTTDGCRRVIIIVCCAALFFVIVILVWRLS